MTREKIIGGKQSHSFTPIPYMGSKSIRVPVTTTERRSWEQNKRLWWWNVILSFPQGIQMFFVLFLFGLKLIECIAFHDHHTTYSKYIFFPFFHPHCVIVLQDGRRRHAKPIIIITLCQPNQAYIGWWSTDQLRFKGRQGKASSRKTCELE